MINDILVKARFGQKHDIEANWLLASDFIPLEGEIIVYDADENNPVSRLKIGDGVLTVNELPFIGEDILNELQVIKENLLEEISTTQQEILEEVEVTRGEINDARIGFDGEKYETLGESIRAQGVKINIEDGAIEGENFLEGKNWKASFPEEELVSDEEGVYTVAYNKQIGWTLEQIKESTITPTIGYYAGKDLSTELTGISEYDYRHKYICDATYQEMYFTEEHGAQDIYLPGDMEEDIPAVLLNLEKPTLIGGIDITSTPYRSGWTTYSPTSFEVQVLDEKGTWNTVVDVKSEDGAFAKGGTESYTFKPVLSTCVRVLIYDGYDNYVKIFEITLYEAKEGKILKQYIPSSVETEVNFDDGVLESVIDGDRTTHCRAFTYTKDSYPIPFTFNFKEETPISHVKIYAYSNYNFTPKKVFITGLIDGEWVDLFGQSTPCIVDGKEKKYNSIQIYDVGLTDTAMIDLGNVYNVTAMRIYVSSRIGGADISGGLVLNEIDFYGPGEANTGKSTIEVVCDDELANTQNPGDIWYFGATVECDNFSEAGRPEIVLEGKIGGVNKILNTTVATTDAFNDYYCTFVIDEQDSDPFQNMTVKVNYFSAENIKNKVCKFSDFVLVNLTETYGEGNEPSVEEYHKLITAPKLNVHKADGSVKYGLSDGLRGPAGQTAYEYAIKGGYTGTEEEFAKLMNTNRIETIQQAKGINVLANAKAEPALRSEIISDENGVISVINNPQYGEYEDQITESRIEPHVGYYLTDRYEELVDEVPSEARLLTDACYNSQSWIKGSAACDYSTMTPAAVLELDRVAKISAVELVAKYKNGTADKAPTNFEIQVKDTTDTWITVANVEENPFELGAASIKYEFTPVKGKTIRILIFDSLGDFPALLEVLVYEKKWGRVLEKVQPIDVSTTTTPVEGGNAVGVMIDGNKYSLYETRDHFPNYYTFHFDKWSKKLISRMKIRAYHPAKYTPKKIIVQALIDDVWHNVYGSANPNPVTGKKYTSIQIYESGLTDTFVLDFDKDIMADQIRLYTSSHLQQDPAKDSTCVFNEVEFYGPVEADGSSNNTGIKYDLEKPVFGSNTWFFGVKAACEGKARTDLIMGVPNPKVLLECHFGNSYETYEMGSIVGDKAQDLFYNVDTSRHNIESVRFYMQYAGEKTDLICKFTDVTMVNLTEAYGEDLEPTADVYDGYRNTLMMSVHTPSGVNQYLLTPPEACKVLSVNGMTGDVTIDHPVKSVNGHMGYVHLDASDIGAAPSGYGWGEGLAKYIEYQNLNYLQTTGLYSLAYPTNTPNSAYYDWMVLVLAKDSAKVYQYAFANKQMWYRESINRNSWYPWEDLNAIDLENLPLLTPVDNNMGKTFTPGLYQVTTNQGAPASSTLVLLLKDGTDKKYYQLAFLSDGKIATRTTLDLNNVIEWQPWKYPAYGDFVSYKPRQGLTDYEKSVARENIGAIGSDEANTLLNQTRDYIYMRDSETGENYKVYVKNGQLTMELEK